MRFSDQQYPVQQVSSGIQKLILNERIGFENVAPVVGSIAGVVGLNWEIPYQTTLDGHGGDLHGGVTVFCESHSGATPLYDMTHQAATLRQARSTIPDFLLPSMAL